MNRTLIKRATRSGAAIILAFSLITNPTKAAPVLTNVAGLKAFAVDRSIDIRWRGRGGWGAGALAAGIIAGLALGSLPILALRLWVRPALWLRAIWLRSGFLRVLRLQPQWPFPGWIPERLLICNKVDVPIYWATAGSCCSTVRRDRTLGAETECVCDLSTDRLAFGINPNLADQRHFPARDRHRQLNLSACPAALGSSAACPCGLPHLPQHSNKGGEIC